VASSDTLTSIARTALILTGSSEEIAHIDQANSQNARTIKELFPIARRSALACHPWNCATDTVKLLPESATPDERGFLYYREPVDCLRWLPWGNDDCERFEGEEVGRYGRVTGNFIKATQSGFIWFRHIWDNDDLSTWPPLLVDAMANRLAFNAVLAKTNSVGIRDRLESSLDDILAKAKHADGLATGNRSLGRVATGSRLAQARTGGIRSWGR
jgi:hypothetical protein